MQLIFLALACGKSNDPPRVDRAPAESSIKRGFDSAFEKVLHDFPAASPDSKATAPSPSQ
jgi:hypothetical protein